MDYKIKCLKCGYDNEVTSNFCAKCSNDLSNQYGHPQSNQNTQQNQSKLRCSRCGSNNFQAIANVKTKTKGFGFCSGCFGFLILGPIGTLCGLCGMGKTKSKTNIEYVCLDCGKRF
jgi:DNA-directed RNA polymerase subunit RPC12/RpoP